MAFGTFKAGIKNSTGHRGLLVSLRAADTLRDKVTNNNLQMLFSRLSIWAFKTIQFRLWRKNLGWDSPNHPYRRVRQEDFWRPILDLRSTMYCLYLFFVQ